MLLLLFGLETLKAALAVLGFFFYLHLIVTA